MAKRQLDVLIERIDAEITELEVKTSAELQVLYGTRARLVQQRDEHTAKRKPKTTDRAMPGKSPDVGTQ